MSLAKPLAPAIAVAAKPEALSFLTSFGTPGVGPGAGLALLTRTLLETLAPACTCRQQL